MNSLRKDTSSPTGCNSKQGERYIIYLCFSQWLCHQLETTSTKAMRGFVVWSECFNFSSCNFMINVNKNSVKYWQGNHVTQLTLAENTEIKNLGCATPDLLISQSSQSRIHNVWETLTLIYTLNRSRWVAVLNDTLSLSLLINQIIILAPDLSYERPTNRHWLLIHTIVRAQV